MNDDSGDLRSASDSASRFVLIGLLLLAGSLRLYGLELISVTNETAYQELTAATALSFEGGEWPLAGPPTEDVRSSAFLVTAIALTKLLWWSPFSGIVFVIVLNLIGVAILFRLCARQFGLQVAVIATLLYCVSPWGVLYSRLLLPSSCLVCFSLLLMDLSFKWLEERGKQQLFMLVLLSFLIPQIHYSGLWVPLWLLVVLYVGRKQISYASLIVGGLLGFVAWIPWLKFQRIQNWTELKTWTAQIFQSPREHGTALIQSLDHFQSMMHSSGFEYWFGSDQSEWPQYFPSWMQWGLGISAVLLVGILIVSVVQIIIRRTDRGLLLLLLWIGLPLFFGAVMRLGIHPENLLIAFPAPFILVAIALAQFQKSSRHKARFIPMTVVLIVTGCHLAWLSGVARFVQDHRTTTAGQYELSYEQRQATLETIIEKAEQNSIRIVGPYSGWYPAYEYVLMFERETPNAKPVPIDQEVLYWIDEQAHSADSISQTQRNQKERQINLAISEYLFTPPNWVIEDHWTFESTQIYQLRFKQKKAFQ